MRPSRLTDDLAGALAEVDRLAARHREGERYAAAAPMAEFLHGQLRLLRQRLAQVRAASDILEASGGSGAPGVWEQLCADLRAGAPPALRDPGAALADPGLDLLRLVAYTGASAALAESCCARLVEQIALCAGEASHEQAWRRVRKRADGRM